MMQSGRRFELRSNSDEKFKVAIARTFALEDWREALDVSQRGRAHGKLVLLSADTATQA